MWDTAGRGGWGGQGVRQRGNTCTYLTKPQTLASYFIERISEFLKCKLVHSHPSSIMNICIRNTEEAV